MAEPDYTLASRPYIPQAKDALETAQGLERYGILKSQHKISDLEAFQKEKDTQALIDYGNSRDAKSLEGASPELRSSTLSGDVTQEAMKKDVMSRTAAYIQGEKDPKIKKALWDTYGTDWVRKGWVSKEIWDKHKDTVNDDILGNLARGNMGVGEHRETTGQTAGARAAQEAPYQGREINPNVPYGYPAVRPGGPAEGAPNTNALTPNAPYGGAPSNAGPRPPGTVNLTDTKATVLPGVPGTPSAAPGTNIRAVDKTNPYSAEVPEVPVGRDMPTGKGIVNQGMDPLRATARTEGLKNFNETIAPMATAASKQESSLGTIRSEIESGRASTDKLAEVKNMVGGLLYAVTKDPAFVKNSTGLDMSSQEVVNKETVRMGMTYARETNGARQAVQALTIELAANPSMLTTQEGNLKVVKIMEAGAKYDKEMGKAAEAYMQKNDGHLTGFENWWAEKHPAAAFISKAVPYQVPGTVGDMRKGITYETKLRGPDGEPLKNKAGKDVIRTGVWNGTGLE